MALTVGELVAYLKLDRAEFRRGLAEAKVEARTSGRSIADSLGVGLLSHAGRIGATFGKVVAVGLSAGLAVSGVSNLAAALVPLTGLLIALPGIAVAGGVAFGVLKLGMSGVGDTLKAGLEGDTKKYAAALKGLAPAARDAVHAIVGLKPAFEKVRSAVQGELFAGAGAEIRDLGRVYLPVLQAGLPKVAASLSAFGENFANAARSGPLLTGVRAIIDATARGLAHANDHVGRLTRAFGSLLSVAAPLVERLGVGFDKVIGAVSAFINKAARDGQLSGWLEGAIDTVKALGTVFANIGRIIAYVMGAANTAGSGLFQTLADLTGQLFAFLRSVQGASALTAIFSAVAAFGAALRTALGAVLPALGAALAAIGPQIGPMADALASVVVALAPLLPVAGQLAAAILPQLAQTITSLIPAISGAVSVIAVLGGWLARYAGWIFPLIAGLAAMVGVIKLVSLAVRVWTAAQVLLDVALNANPIGLIVLAIAALVGAFIYAYTHSETFRRVVQAALAGVAAAAHAVVDFFAGMPAFFSRVWGAITGAFSTAKAAIGAAIGAVVQFFADLPGRVLGFLASLPGRYVAFWVATMSAALFAIGFAIGATLRFFINLPGWVMAAVARIPGLLVGLWNRAWALSKAVVSAGAAAVVGFFKALPGRAGAALSSLWGRISGAFTSAKSRATAAASALVSSVVSWLRGLPGRAAVALAGLPGRIKGVFAGASGWLVQAGRDVLAGLANGITGAMGGLIDKAKSAASKIISGFKAGLGIGSPSRRMRDEVGRWIPPGIAEGIRRATPELEAQMRSLVDMPRNIRIPAVSLSAGARAAAASGLPLSARTGPDLAEQLRRLADQQAREHLADLPPVHVYIGDRELTDMIDVRVETKGRATAGAARAGTGRAIG